MALRLGDCRLLDSWVRSDPNHTSYDLAVTLDEHLGVMAKRAMRHEILQVVSAKMLLLRMI